MGCRKGFGRDNLLTEYVVTQYTTAPNIAAISQIPWSVIYSLVLDAKCICASLEGSILFHKRVKQCLFTNPKDSRRCITSSNGMNEEEM